MKRLVAVMAIALLAVGGCKKKSEPGGGSDKDDQVRIVVPRMATSIKQGETRAIDVELDRGKNMKDAVVALSFEAPPGVSVKPKAFTMKGGDSKMTLDVTVDKKADTGDKAIKVTEAPEKGDKASIDLPIKVTSR
jgi:hypothetical protein